MNTKKETGKQLITVRSNVALKLDPDDSFPPCSFFLVLSSFWAATLLFRPAPTATSDDGPLNFPRSVRPTDGQVVTTTTARSVHRLDRLDGVTCYPWLTLLREIAGDVNDHPMGKARPFFCAL